MRKLMSMLLVLAFAGTVSAQSVKQVESAIKKMQMAQASIAMMYVDTVNVNRITEAGIQGMLKELDPHSTYTNAEDTKKLNEPLKGSFSGIGVQFNMVEDTLLVIQPVSKGPSEKVGILAGDRIVTVNDSAIAGVKMSKEEIMRRLRGPKGSKVKLGIVRRGVSGVSDFMVTRADIPVHSVDASYMAEPGVGYIRFSSFGATTHKEVLDALTKLKKQGMKSLILDLEGNGGGYMDAAVKIANEFLQKGDLIVYTKSRRFPSQRFTAEGGGCFTQGKVVVLVDEYTASAAEIVTGAIQDQDRGYVIGRRSFGKGLVQRPLDLPDGSMIRLTIARYYTPSGRCIQKPYTKGDKTSYEKDVINRYNNGELTSADSIHFPDSLRFKTLREGRVVYGGGGIMPDKFVPLDTTYYTKYHRELSAKSVIINTALRYIDNNRKALNRQYPNFKTFMKKFEVPQSLLDQLVENGKAQKVEPKDDEEKNTTLQRVKVQLKALVARDLWDMDEYFQIINTTSNSMIEALKYLKE